MHKYKKERKKMKKKILAALMVSVAVLTAAGCSGGSQASSEPVEIQSVDDLADLKIGVQIGTTGDSQATDAVKDDSQVNRFNKGADAIVALKNGKVDCVVIDSLPAEKFVEANDDLKIVDGIFDKEEYAICMKKSFLFTFRRSLSVFSSSSVSMKSPYRPAVSSMKNNTLWSMS